MASSIILKAKDPDDLREQERRHRVNALAQAIHASGNHRPVKAPVRHPYRAKSLPAAPQVDQCAPPTALSPALPSGISGVYDVRPASFIACLAGAPPARITPPLEVIDTRTASVEAQAWLREYRLAGSEAMPWRYCKQRQRYYAQSSVKNAVREMLHVLMQT